MAGLTRSGFVPLSYDEILGRIKTRLEAASPGIDLSSESPDGHEAEILSFMLAQVWSELGLVHNSYNPNNAVGAGLRNLGLITGIPFGTATRSQADVALIGETGTVVSKDSIVYDSNNNEFKTLFEAVIPATVRAVAKLSGPIDMPIGAINRIGTSIDGWTGVQQPTAGRVGSAAQSDVQFRNIRNGTVMRNFTSVTEVIRGRLQEELNISQVVVLNNDHATDALSDGTPAGHIHVTLGEVDASISNEAIAKIILDAKGAGCPTYGDPANDTVVNDSQGNPHTISFSRAEAQPVFIVANVTFLDPDYAGASELIVNDLVETINQLATGEDVIWSHLFGAIIPHSRAQVNSLQLSYNGTDYVTGNLEMSASQFADTSESLIDIQVTNT